MFANHYLNIASLLIRQVNALTAHKIAICSLTNATRSTPLSKIAGSIAKFQVFLSVRCAKSDTLLT